MRYATDLEQPEFQVFEDGVLQEVTYFNRSNLPIGLALLVDTSASMESRLPTAQEAAVGVRAAAASAGSGRDHRLRQPRQHPAGVHEQHRSARAGDPRTSAGGSTSLYNAVYIALKELKKIIAKDAEDIRRQAIVVLSDGEDTSSLLPFEEVLDLAKRSETAIYAIGLRDSDGGPGQGFKEAEFVLRQLSQETGGRTFFPIAGHRAARDLHADRRGTVEPVHRRLHLEEPEA